MNGDLISREATKHIISQDPRIDETSKERVLNYLDGMIGVDQVRPKGRWIYNDGYNTCSVCHNEVAEYDDCGRRQDFILCPTCGADMRESE